jgi:acid phosphatase family membrane protein YuiD
MAWTKEHRPSRSAVIGTTAGAIAVALGVCARTGYTRPIDRRVRRAIRPDQGRVAVGIAKGLTRAAGPAVHPLIAVAASVAISRIKHEPSYAPVFASIGALALDLFARELIYQPRPRRASHHLGLERFAYPSGHTAAAAAIMISSALELGEHRSSRERAAMLALASLCAAAVGWSRLELDEHWIDDVVGGFATGTVTAIVATAFVRRRPAITRRLSSTRE